MPQHLPLDPTRANRAIRPVGAGLPDPAAADELRTAIVTARSRLLDVLHARARTLASVTTWEGPHRTRYDEDAAELLAAGRALDESLRQLLVGLEAELDGLATP